MARKHNRRSIRLRGFDYASAGAYFITLNIKHRAPMLGSIRNGAMCLSDIGRIVQEEWERTGEIRPGVALDEYILMPDHMHMIVWIRDGMNTGADGIRPITKKKSKLGNIIGGFKSSVTRRIRNEDVGADAIRPGESIWHRNYYERIIRDERAQRALTYFARFTSQTPATVTRLKASVFRVSFSPRMAAPASTATIGFTYE